MSVRCPNTVCRTANEDQAWHCAKCGCPMGLDPSEIEYDEDRLDLPTFLTMTLVFVAGLGVLAGMVYGMLPPPADPTSAA